MLVRHFFAGVVILTALTVQSGSHKLPDDDAVRIHEFYRLASEIQDKVWANWSQTPGPMLLVTDDAEYLTHFPEPPKEFKRIADDVYERPRRFSVNLAATFPAFGLPAVIVIGQPPSTPSRSSTPWLITLMHEHFHQLQYATAGYYAAVEHLGLSRGDKNGMWMLNYPFPYEKPEVAQAFASLRDLLLRALDENDESKFAELMKAYVRERRGFLGLLSADDQKYFNFQLWQEGIARYTQIKCAEAAANYRPSAEFAALADYEPFGVYAARARSDTLRELKSIELPKSKRLSIYPFGGAEGLLLDRANPAWKSEYFEHLLSTESLFTLP